jgi:hypothetical protein
MSELSIPVATLVGAEMTQHTICESIKSLRDSYREFCEEDEFVETIIPIEQDPEPYANGTKKTRPILKKYAQALLDKIIFDQQLEAEAEAQRDANLTPQQVKADMKRYVSICEKKIAKQQEQCDALQKQVEQLSEIVRCIVTYPHLQDLYNSEYKPQSSGLFYDGIGGTNSRLLAHCSMLDTNSLDYFIEQGVEIESEKYSALHYAIYAKNIKNVKKLLDSGANVNQNSYLYVEGSHKLFIMPNGSKQCGNYTEVKRCGTPLEVASMIGSLEIVKLLIEKGATIGDPIYEYRNGQPYKTGYKVPNGPEGDLVAGYLQTHGSSPVTRF